LKYALYRSKKVGTGTLHDPYRSKIVRDYIRTELPDGTNAWNWIHPIAPAQYVLAYADETTLAAIDADADNRRLSPAVATLPELQAWLDGPHSGITTGGEADMEVDGASMAWLATGNTARHVFQYLLKSHWVAGTIEQTNAPNALNFLRNNLDTKLSAIPAAVRNAASNWIQSKGLSTAWMTGNTTVRQVVQYIIENIAWPAPGIGPLSF
jgi:hypothetical protein